jgi:hypothetical protein
VQHSITNKNRAQIEYVGPERNGGESKTKYAFKNFSDTIIVFQRSFGRKKIKVSLRRHDTQHNDIQHNDIQHNDIRHYDIQHNDIQHNDTQYNNIRQNNK